MGISIYYTAYRERALTQDEQKAVAKLIGRYDLSARNGEQDQAAERMRWESFCVYDANDPSEPGVVFEGATGLPMNSEDDFWMAIQHWCRLLTEIRRALPGTTWQVHIDDHDIVWDEERRAYDPSR
jgi:hypothetical protein